MAVGQRVTLNHRTSLTTATFRENFSLCTESFICCTHLGYDGTIRYIMKSNGSELEQVVYTVTSNIVRERLVKKDWRTKFQSSLLNIYFHLSGLSCLSYLFTSAKVRISVYTAAKRGTEPIRYVTLHFRNPRGTASYRAEITVLWRVNRSRLQYGLRAGPRGTVWTKSAKGRFLVTFAQKTVDKWPQNSRRFGATTEAFAATYSLTHVSPLAVVLCKIWNHT